MGNDPSCPVCGRALEKAAAEVKICGGCFEALEAVATQRVQQTGEFTAVSPERAGQLLSGDLAPDPPAAPSQSVPTCSWCSKPRDEVKKLLSRGEVCICNECVALCVDILSVELGDDWR